MSLNYHCAGTNLRVTDIITPKPDWSTLITETLAVLQKPGFLTEDESAKVLSNLPCIQDCSACGPLDSILQSPDQTLAEIRRHSLHLPDISSAPRQLKLFRLWAFSLHCSRHLMRLLATRKASSCTCRR